MADITMCTHTGCKQQQSCYRKRAIAHEFRQAYADMLEPHPNDPSIPCVNFWAIGDRRDIEPLLNGE